MAPKTGRPKADNPKCVDVKVRVDVATNQKLLSYAQKNNTTRAEVIRRGMDLILGSSQ